MNVCIKTAIFSLYTKASFIFQRLCSCACFATQSCFLLHWSVNCFIDLQHPFREKKALCLSLASPVDISVATCFVVSCPTFWPTFLILYSLFSRLVESSDHSSYSMCVFLFSSVIYAQHRRRHIFHRYRAQLPYDIRRPRWRSSFRP